jgi:hypothetical protein
MAAGVRLFLHITALFHSRFFYFGRWTWWSYERERHVSAMLTVRSTQRRERSRSRVQLSVSGVSARAQHSEKKSGRDSRWGVSDVSHLFLALPVSAEEARSKFPGQ